MVVALLSAAGLILAVLLGHVVMDLMNARRDYQFYAEVARIRATLRDADQDTDPTDRLT